MPRRRLLGSGGVIFHVMNRSAKQLPLFESCADYRRFLDVLVEAEERYDMRLIDYCVMSTHFHLIVWPRRDDDLPDYLRWVAGVHAQRWRRDRQSQGKGAVYQGRYRWVAVQDDIHLDNARRYVAQNPVSAGMVRDVYAWPWSSVSVIDVGPRPTLTVIRPLPKDLAEPLAGDVAKSLEGSVTAKRTFGSPQWRHSFDVELILDAAGKPLSKSSHPR